MTGHNGFTIATEGSVTTPKGFRAGGVYCGIKKVQRYDLGAIVCDVPAIAAGVFTTNVVVAAPLTVTKEDMDWFLNALDEVLADTLKIPGTAWDTVMGLAKRTLSA